MNPTFQRNMDALPGISLGAARLAHDMKNLLQIISSAIQLIDREVDRGNTAAIHRLAQSAQSSVDRAAALSREFLDVAAVDSEDPFVNVGVVLFGMRDLIALTAGPSIKVEVLSGDGLPSVRCSRRKLENALLNLVANARDAMPEGGQLTIALFMDDTAVSLTTGAFEVVLKVNDTGHGMSAGTLKQVLTPFFTTKPASQGTGLGLSSVRDFVANCGGSVSIDSVVGEGTSVMLRLPCDVR